MRGLNLPSRLNALKVYYSWSSCTTWCLDQVGRLREAHHPDEVLFIGQSKWTQTICIHESIRRIAIT